MADRWRTLKPGVGMRDMKANLNFSEYFLESVLINGLERHVLERCRSAKRRIAPGPDASQHESIASTLCAGEVAWSRLRS